MLYRFKSQVCADVVMLEGNGRQMLEIMGKSLTPSGIVTVDQIPAAIAAIEAAVASEGQQGTHNRDARAAEDHDEVAEAMHVSLFQRAGPLLAMLKESLAQKKDVVWNP